jgi:hypothetical protein
VGWADFSAGGDEAEISTGWPFETLPLGVPRVTLKTSAKHVVAEMEDLRTGVRFPPPPPIVQCKELLFAPVLALVGLLGVTYLRVTWYL